MYVKPKEASKYYNVSPNCLAVWSRQGKIDHITTAGGHHRYLVKSTIEGPQKPQTTKIIYSRVSSRKQQNDLVRQSDYLKTKYPSHVLITDIGSGINFERPGFKRILEGVFNKNITEVVVAHRDRLTRFGYPLFEWIFKQHNTALICDQSSDENSEKELSDDLIAIITVFTTRYHGKRKYRTNKLLSESQVLPNA